MRLNSVLSELRLYLCNAIVGHFPSRRVRRAYLRHAMGFQIGQGAAIHLRCRFDAARGFQIGPRSVINAGSRLDTRGGITIGYDTSISENVTILTASHDLQDAGFAGSQASVRIGNHSFIGTGALLLPGSEVGDRAALAAGSVLTKAIPAGEIWAGIPARRIGQRPEILNYTLSYDRFLH